MIDVRYLDWIAAQDLPNGGQGKCDKTTKAMVKAFPELRRVRGHYHDPLWGPRAHWWCETEAGDVVDPTVAQFTEGGTYEEWNDARSEPTGKCPNCGDECFNHRYFCSIKCGESYAAYVSGKEPL